ncbi:uncharacterized protein LOC125749580 isoform X2 [Brienomyrus brachyistius]|uniref:uncharacterized protein LOC125749580 isoform X2 n=1 Tax=Brienomyrus brachyistius TaxID=42636 RepID=UPI0020B38A20|nr:uncharacterized protein LOC125749580 isoform X2 [Brienomyrus brachyistius]
MYQRKYHCKYFPFRLYIANDLLKGLRSEKWIHRDPDLQRITVVKIMMPIIALLILVLTNQLEGSDDFCAEQIRVPRDTITSAVENSPVTLHCPVKHCGWRPAITWCKLWNVAHCIPVNAADNIKIQWKYSETEPSTGTSDLIFTRVSMGDAGQYRCWIYGNVTTVSHYIKVSVTGSDDVCPVEIRVPRNTVTSAVENSPVTLHCPVKHCEPRPAVTWCKLWNPTHCITVNATDNIKIQWNYNETEPNTGTSELIFTRVSMGDAGLYRCGVYGTVTIVSHHMNVSVTENVNQCAVEIPKQWDTVILAVDKSSVTLNCPVRHCGGTPTLTWCKSKTTPYCMTVKETDNIKIEWKRDITDPDISTSRLVFKEISKEDAGLYRCDVFGSAPPVSHHINITVTVLPAYGPRSELVAVLDSQLHTPTTLKQNQLHSSGEKCKYTFVSEDCWWSRAADAPLTMSCRAALEKPATVTWCKQEGGLCTPLEDKDKYSLIWLQPSPAWGVSYLTVYNIGAADSGEYHCHASPAGACVTGDVLSRPIRLLVSGDVVRECGRDVTGPLAGS